jgi:hypothetical protein
MNIIGRRDTLGFFFGAGAALALSACTSDGIVALRDRLVARPG